MEQKNNGGLVSRINRHLATIALGATIVGCNESHLVVQYDDSGQPLNCWKAPGEVWVNDGATIFRSDDGKYRIMGNVVSMPVADDQWEAAAQALGIDLSRCTNGRYRSE